MNRRYKQLTAQQRYQIEAYLKSGMTCQFIASQLRVSKSTITRELQRNRTKTGKYHAATAQTYTEERKERYGRIRRFKH